MSREKHQAYPPRKPKPFNADQGHNEAVFGGLGKALIVAMMLADEGCEILTVFACFRNPRVHIIPSASVIEKFQWGTKKSDKRHGRTISLRDTNYHGVEIEWRDDQ